MTAPASCGRSRPHKSSLSLSPGTGWLPCERIFLLSKIVPPLSSSSQGKGGGTLKWEDAFRMSPEWHDGWAAAAAANSGFCPSLLSLSLPPCFPEVKGTLGLLYRGWWGDTVPAREILESQPVPLPPAKLASPPLLSLPTPSPALGAGLLPTLS